MAVKDFYHLFVIVLIKIVSWSSSNRLRELLASILASTAFTFSRTKRRLMEKNISLAYGGNLTTEQRQRIVKASFREFWLYILSWLPSKEDLSAVKEAELHGIEHLHKALEKGMGVILWESNGFGKRLLAKRILHELGFSIHQLHGANDLGGFFMNESPATWVKLSMIRPFFENCEMKIVAGIIYLPSSNSLAFSRTLLSLLKENGILCISGDGKGGHKFIPLRFLGQTEFFPTGMVSMSKLSGAPILPVFCIKEGSGKTTLNIEHPINAYTDKDRKGALENCVSIYAGILETYIKLYPEQYRNWHLVGKVPNNLS
jgi:lauroyl/myristoyl acyltransferase